MAANPQEGLAELLAGVGTEAEPAAEDSASDSDEDMDAEGEPEDDGKEVEIPWDWLVKEAELEDLEELEPLAAAQDTNGSHVKKVLKDIFTGEWEYIEYFPEWTDPDYNPDYEIYPESQTQKRRKKRDVSQVLRPAILVQDQIKNPTLHALRWGMHPDGTAGRSFVTPTVRIPTAFDVPGEGPKTARDFLNVTIPTVGNPQGVSLRDYLESHAGARDTLDPGNDKMQAWLKLYDAISYNQDFQKYLFRGFTTDEFVDQQAYDPANIIISDSDLQGPIHPLVERTQWMGTEHLGGDINRPRQLYNVYGCRGEYSAWDDLIWATLQPALQIVTRILSSDHPYWLALLSIYNRFPIDWARDPRRFDQQDKVFIRCGLRLDNDPIYMWNEAQNLKKLDFPSSEVTLKVLNERILWEFGSAYRPAGHPKQTSSVYGSTTYNHALPNEPPIRIQLGTELVFPLLVHEYTMGEKAVCSFVIAAVMLHELAHAVNFAHEIVLGPNRDWQKMDPKFSNFGPDVEFNLLELGERLIDDSAKLRDEIFFDNEERAEAGWAFENKLFGGVVENVPSTDFINVRWQTILAMKRRWPNAASNPHKSAIDGKLDWLYSPPAHIIDVDELMPVSMCARFFSEDFWTCETQKYGWQSFKFTPSKYCKALTSSSLPWAPTMNDYYGSSSIRKWIRTAGVNLRRAGHNIISEYLTRLSWQDLEPENTRVVWFFEHDTWPETDRQLDHLIKGVRQKNFALWQLLYFVLGPRAVIDQQLEQARQQWRANQASGQNAGGEEPTLQSFMEEYVSETFRAFFRLFQVMDECHRILTTELGYLQNMIADYLLASQPVRQMLWNIHAVELGNRLLNVHVALANLCLQLLTALERPASILVRYNGKWPQIIVEEIKRYNDLFQMDANHFMHTRSYLDKKYITSDESPRSLETVRAARKRNTSEDFRQMAIREMSLITEPILKEVIEKWYKIISRRSEFSSNTASAEALGLKASVKRSVKAIEKKLKSQNTSLSKFIAKGENVPSRLGTAIFNVPEKRTDPAQAPAQAPANVVQNPIPVAPPPQILKLADFQQTPASGWSRLPNVNVNLGQQQGGGFAQFSNLPGFSAAGPPAALWNESTAQWEPNQPLAGSTATPIMPFPHPYATRDTISEDIESEKHAMAFTNELFGGESLQTQQQHGTYGTYREEHHSEGDDS